MGMRVTFITAAVRRDDFQWLFDVHIKDPSLAKCRSAMIYGNEDCPDKIEVWFADYPLAYEMPAAVFVRNDDGELIEQRN